MALMVCLCFGLTGIVGAAEEARVPTTITSDSMTYEDDGKKVVFTGNVHVVRQDFQLWSGKLTIYFSTKNPSDVPKSRQKGFGQETSQVEKIIAVKNVRLESQGKKGYCGKLTYWQDKELLQMEEEPRLKDGKNEIRGEIIKLFVRDNRSEIIGGKKRVQAVFFSRPDQVK